MVWLNAWFCCREKLRPLEAAAAFSVLNQPLSDAEFNAPPSVLLVGQYSVGKTTFIRNLIGKDFNQRIGPEPTTVSHVSRTAAP